MNRLTSNKITYLSFLLAISIVWHHTYNVQVYELTGTLAFIETYLLQCFEVSVSVFLMISGFLFYYNYSEEKMTAKMKSRLFSLVIPYLLWNMIGYLYFQILSVFPGLRQYYGGSIGAFSFIDMIRSMINGDYNLVTWFLKSLIIYSYVLPFFYPLFKKKAGSVVLFLMSLVLGVLFGEQSNTCAFSCYYCLGILIAINFKNQFTRRYSVTEKTGSILCFFLLVLAYVLFEIPDRSLARMLIYCLLSILLWIGMDFLAVEKQPEWWFKTSFLFFVSHEMILEPVEKIFYLVLGKNTFGAVADYLLAPIISSFIILLFCKFLKKLPVLWNVLSGNRK